MQDISNPGSRGELVRNFLSNSGEGEGAELIGHYSGQGCNFVWSSCGSGKHSHPEEGRRRHSKRVERVEVRKKEKPPEGPPRSLSFGLVLFFCFPLSLLCVFSWVVVRSPYVANSICFLYKNI